MRSGGAGENPNAADACVTGAFNVATMDDQGGAPGISGATSATLQHWRSVFHRRPTSLLSYTGYRLSLFSPLSPVPPFSAFYLSGARRFLARWHIFFPLRAVSHLKEVPSELRVRPSFLPSVHSTFASFHVALPSLDTSALRSFLPTFLPS